jgi:general secretion pathway protein A
MGEDLQFDVSPLPFGISPNPLLLYQTMAIKTTLHKIRYTITRRQGLTCVLGDVGFGKSTILRYAYTEFDALDRVEARLIPTPNFTSDFAFLKAICSEFELPQRRSLLDQQNELQGFLVEKLAEKKVVALFIDEGQKLSNKMLEVVRSMLNFETGEAKLIQLVISGQLDLRDRLIGKEMRAIKSRLVMPTVLNPMSAEETRAMLEWRCTTSQIPVPITDAAHARIYELSGGVPRDVLRLCLTAHEFMKIAGAPAIDVDMIDGASEELSLRTDAETEAALAAGTDG